MNNKVEEMEEKLDKITDKHPIHIPLVVFENAMARAERREKRHFILFVIICVVLALSNICWSYYYNNTREEISSVMIEDTKENIEDRGVREI